MGKHFLFFIFVIAVYNTACTSHSQQTIAPPPSTSIPEDPDNKLIGTTVLRSSERNLNAGYIYGLWLDSAWSSPCTQSSEDVAPVEITAIEQPYDSILMVSVKVNGNCGASFLGEIDVQDSTTINLIATGYGSRAVCVCCYGLTYKIELSDQGEYPFKKLKYVSINGYGKKELPVLRVPVNKLK